jgi:hypothetical protein
MDRGAPASSGPRNRRRLIVAAGAALLVLALVVVLLLTRGDEKATHPAAVGSTAPSTSAEAATTTPGPTSVPAPAATTAPDANQLPPTLKAVSLNAPSQVGDGVVVAVPAIESVNASGQGPGNVAGPALRVTVRITNGTRAAVALGGVAVNLSYGKDATPASPVDDPSQRPFSGRVAPGGHVDAVYVFSVPAGDRDTVTIDVGYKPGAPRALFTGRAA